MKENGWIKVRLDQRIEILTQTDNRTSGGAIDMTFSTLSTISARVRYVARTQKESTIGGRETSIQEVHFDIRYNPSVSMDKVKMVRYKSLLYDIITILERGRSQYLTLVTQFKDSQ